MNRVFNFSPGPAMLPEPVLRRAQAELLDWRGSGMSVMEVSHRGTDFVEFAAESERNLRALLRVPANYKVLFLQGGATLQFAAVPLNLAPAGSIVDYVVTGNWGEKAVQEAERYARVNVAANAKSTKFTTIPDPRTWKVSNAAAYLHYTPNETVFGVEFHSVPEVSDAPLVADMSSTLLSRPIDVSRFGIIYGGAQKNIGPAGARRRDRARGPARSRAPRDAGRHRLQDHGRERLDVEHAGNSVVVLRRSRVRMAQRAGRPRGHGQAQRAQGCEAVRRDRRLGLSTRIPSRNLPVRG